MTDTVAPPITFLTPPDLDASRPRPGVVILNEIVKQLPEQVGANAMQMPAFSAALQVQLSLGRILNVRSSGLTIFQTASEWPDLGVDEHGARARVFRRPPMKALAPPGTMEPAVQLYHALLDLRPRYGSYQPWYNAYFVPFKAERKLMQVANGLITKFNDFRDELADKLPEIHSWMEDSMRAAAAEAYDAYAATVDAPGSRKSFIDRVLSAAERRFPSPEKIQSKLVLEVVDIFPADLQPTAEMIETILGLKEQIEAQTRVALAHAEKEEAEADAARSQAQMLEMRQHAEREMIEQMHERRLAHADSLLRQEAEAQLAPVMAAFEHSRAVIHDSVAKALAYVQDGKAIPGTVIKSLRKNVQLYQLVTVGEVELDEKVTSLEALLKEPAAKRKVNTSFENVLNEIEAMTAVANARLELEAREDEWDALFSGGRHAEVAEDE
jgi:hypothetical protein